MGEVCLFDRKSNDLLRSLKTRKTEVVLMLQISLNGTLDTDAILNMERHETDSPFQNLAPIMAAKEFNKDTLFQILMICALERKYFKEKLSKMSEKEKRGFFRVSNTEKLPDYRDIHVKQAYKSFSELCRFLNEPDNLKGKQRIQQMNRFKRCFNWKETGIGNEIVITQKYGRPKPEKTKGNGNVVFLKHMEYLLLAYLYNWKDNIAELTLTDIMIDLGMVKKEYQKLKNTLYQKEDINTEDSAMKDFVQDVQNVAYQIVYRTLESLSDRRLIVYRKITTINNESATIEQLDVIRHTELELLKKYHLKKISQVHMKTDIQRRFYAERNEILLEKYGWKYIQSKYQIKSNHDDILYGIQGITDEIKKELSVLFKNRMLHEYDKRKEQYENDVAIFSNLFDDDTNYVDKEDALICYDIVADVKSDERQKYLNKYLQMITSYLL